MAAAISVEKDDTDLMSPMTSQNIHDYWEKINAMALMTDVPWIVPWERIDFCPLLAWMQQLTRTMLMLIVLI
jgi:hypothetical protein